MNNQEIVDIKKILKEEMSAYTLYTKESCVYCEQAKEIIEEEKLNIEVIKMNEEDLKRLKEQGLKRMPALELKTKSGIQVLILQGYEVINYIKHCKFRFKK